ncbi:MAG: complex I subunit 4 family protein [Acidimicrobiales bacterium]
MTNLLALEEAHAATGFPVLAIMVALPLVGAAVMALIPRTRPDMHRLVAIITACTAGAITLWVLYQFKTNDPGFQFVVSQTWVSSFDIKFYLGVDGISLFLLVLTGVLFPIALFAARPDHDEKGYYLWITLLMAGCLGVFCALDLFLFFLFFELTIVPLYFLIGRWGHGRKVYAATKFFLFTMFGSAFMLVSIVALALLAHAGEAGQTTFDLLKIVDSGAISQNWGRVLFCGFAIAFMVKTPVFPFHTWLPDAHTEAPTAGSIDLAGVLLKLGTYGFMRYGLYLFPEATVWAAPVMLTLAVIGIIYGAIVATMQKNLKRLVAYSSVSHMGFAILGLFALTTQGLEGSILVMINHGITTGAMFILLGFLYTRRHTYDIASLKGLQTVAPVFAGLFTIVMLSSIGVPGLNGFVGEFLVLLGTFVSHRWWAVVAATGVILAALYMLWAYQRVFHGEVDEANRDMPDLKLTERLVMVPLVLMIVFLGVYPKPVLERIQPSVDRLLTHVEEVNRAAGRDFHIATTEDGEHLSPVADESTDQSTDESSADSGSAAADASDATTTTTEPGR